MKPVPRRDLGVLAIGLAVAAFLLVRAYYGDVPPLRWWLGLPLALLAIAEALGARTLRIRLTAQREARAGTRPTTAAPALSPVRPVDPLLVARIAVLAQASAWVGAGFAGLWAGVLGYVASAVGELRDATGDTVTSALGLGFSVGLVAAALWLESVCRVPPGDPGAGARA